MTTTAGPWVFRILLSSDDLSASRRFYESLLGRRGRPIATGRIYFDCGPVLLGVVERSDEVPGTRSRPTEAVYFATDDLDAIYRRASRLGCRTPGYLHGDRTNPLGEVRVRPWGERSFYVEDPSGNPLCFVDARTLFTGTPRQLRALHGNRPAKATRRPPARRRRRP